MNFADMEDCMQYLDYSIDSSEYMSIHYRYFWLSLVDNFELVHRYMHFYRCSISNQNYIYISYSEELILRDMQHMLNY